MGKRLYKYKSLDNYKNFIDIILNERLYAANYKDMNDPMEGQYLASNAGTMRSISEKIRNEKMGIRIVSLSRELDHFLLWSHYANGHRGVAIGVEVNEKKYIVKEIEYSDSFFEVENLSDSLINETAIQILCHKKSDWKYEKEERIFVQDGSCFANVSIKEIIAGRSMKDEEYNFLQDVVNRINPKIEIRRMEKEIDTSRY